MVRLVGVGGGGGDGGGERDDDGAEHGDGGARGGGHDGRLVGMSRAAGGCSGHDLKAYLHHVHQ